MLSCIRFTLILLLISIALPSFSQSNTYTNVFSESKDALADSLVQLVNEHITIEPNTAQWKKILQEKPATLKIALPAPDGSVWKITLNAHEPVSKGFKVTTNNVTGRKVEVDVFTGLHYQGTFEDGRKGVVAISILDEEWMGVISYGTGNYVLGRVGNHGTKHILYNDASLRVASPFKCGAIEPENFAVSNSADNEGNRATVNCVNIYVEAAYRVYQAKGSNITTTTQWLTGLFHVVSQLYANDLINVRMSELFVNTSIDMYHNYDLAENVLYDFSDNNPSYNGDLAHYVTTNALWTDAGGIAFLEGLCGYGYGTSELYSSYSALPTYSWSVNVLAHELGHNLGSPHTHSCSWSGGPIDTCYTVEGGCYNGADRPKSGTIMSYCHLNGSINFNLGFGPKPKATIQNYINANTFCLDQIIDPVNINLGTTANFCPGQSLSLTVNGGSPGSSGRWAWYEGSCGTTLVGTGRNITLSPTQATQYFVRGEGCSNTSCLSITVTPGVSSIPPTAIAATTDVVCSGTNTQLTISGGQLAPGAQWEWFTGNCGTTVVGSGTSLTVTPTATTSYLVRANGGCGVTPCLSIPISVMPNPGLTTTRDTTIFIGSCITLAARGGNNFEWSTGETTSFIEVCGNVAGAQSYQVTASNNGICGQSKSITITFAEPTGINEIHNGAISIYPNPNSGTFTISIQNATDHAQVEIMDVLGRIVYTHEYPLVNGLIQVTAALPNGMYVVKVGSGNATTFKKILVTQ
ncbi:hypothetical protein BH09BAC1_BH09BAC1_01160 [soil metagenome]